MRKFLLPLAAAGAFIAAASPAAAQYYGAPPPQPGYGWNGDWGRIRELGSRIVNIRSRIERLDAHDAIGHRNADRLVHEANQIDRRLHDKARGGLNAREAGDIEYRIQRLDQCVQWAMAGRWDQVQRDWDRDRY